MGLHVNTIVSRRHFFLALVMACVLSSSGCGEITALSVSSASPQALPVEKLQETPVLPRGLPVFAAGRVVDSYQILPQAPGDPVQYGVVLLSSESPRAVYDSYRWELEGNHWRIDSYSEEVGALRVAISKGPRGGG